MKANAYRWVNLLVETLFILDMILMFLTSYLSSKGKEIKESDLIA